MAQMINILDDQLKVIEVAAKVLEAIAYGNVILPAAKRLQVVKLWLPFVRGINLIWWKTIIPPITVDGELWQSLESAFVSIILALPSGDQAEILSEWLGCEYIQYPDLTEAFEVWCYRSKVAKRRFTLLGDIHGITNSSMTLS
uniref:BTB/POZ domain-containing protein At3g05675-like n=1 Tax=Nelumbo nucifera TaxID=4432 RepID=A0A822ZTT6_NELNU|nr:TPA_asm: hypothetical protein HUJ06_018300 [Nelumbo nucifera]